MCTGSLIGFFGVWVVGFFAVGGFNYLHELDRLGIPLAESSIGLLFPWSLFGVLVGGIVGGIVGMLIEARLTNRWLSDQAVLLSDQAVQTLEKDASRPQRPGPRA